MLPLTDEVVRNHLLGADPQDRSGRDFTIGVYPMLPDETCWLLAADFDKASWPDDTRAFLETCHRLNVPAALERSRSGNGGHIWIFFSERCTRGSSAQSGGFLAHADHNLAVAESPAWSPDSQQIAFDSDRSSNYQLYVMNADGSGQTQLTNDPDSAAWPTWTR